MSYIDRRWQSWLSDVVPNLKDGAKIEVPVGLPRPSTVGFVVTTLAESVGQLRDWSRGTPDGGRLHVHEYTGQRFVVHLDRVSPERGVLPAIWHWFTESPTGKAVGLALLLGAAVKATSQPSPKRRRRTRR